MFKIWNIATGLCEMSTSGHSNFVWFIVAIDEILICSASHDKTIKVWNVSDGVCVRTLEGHTDWVLEIVVLLFDGRLCSVSFDCTAKI